MFKKTPKKKKGCLSKIFSTLITLTIIAVVLVFLFDDETDYISDEQIAAAQSEDEVAFDDFLDMLFDWYGYIPDDYAEYYDDYDDFYGDDWNPDEYADYDLAEYYNDFDYDDEDYGYSSNKKISRSGNRSSDSGYSDQYFDDDVPAQPRSSQSNDNNSSERRSSERRQSDSRSSSERRNVFVDCAKTYLGIPYVYGGRSRSGIDCSGLVLLAAKDAGLGNLPATAKTQFSVAGRVSEYDRQPGDLVFFSSGGTISHVAIYIGDNTILHAVSDGSKTGVITSKLSEKYWKNHYYSSGRIIVD